MTDREDDAGGVKPVEGLQLEWRPEPRCAIERELTLGETRVRIRVEAPDPGSAMAMYELAMAVEDGDDRDDGDDGGGEGLPAPAEPSADETHGNIPVPEGFHEFPAVRLSSRGNPDVIEMSFVFAGETSGVARVDMSAAEAYAWDEGTKTLVRGVRVQLRSPDGETVFDASNHVLAVPSGRTPVGPIVAPEMVAATAVGAAQSSYQGQLASETMAAMFGLGQHGRAN